MRFAGALRYTLSVSKHATLIKVYLAIVASVHGHQNKWVSSLSVTCSYFRKDAFWAMVIGSSHGHDIVVMTGVVQYKSVTSPLSFLNVIWTLRR